MQFQDRQDAGRQLASALKKYAGQELAVYALPRGGVVLGAIVAQELKVPLDLLIVRKIGHPNNPEYAIAAVGERGEAVANEAEVSAIDPEWFREEIANQRAEATRRRKLYLAGRMPVAAAGKTCIIVDDGLATGLTMKAAIKELRPRQPQAIVVAVPVAPGDEAERLRSLVSDVVVLHTSREFGAIGFYYQNFEQVSDEEVISLMSQFGN